MINYTAACVALMHVNEQSVDNPYRTKYVAKGIQGYQNE